VGNWAKFWWVVGLGFRGDSLGGFWGIRVSDNGNVGTECMAWSWGACAGSGESEDWAQYRHEWVQGVEETRE
jgi:hypothetical protein